MHGREVAGDGGTAMAVLQPFHRQSRRDLDFLGRCIARRCIGLRPGFSGFAGGVVGRAARCGGRRQEYEEKGA